MIAGVRSQDSLGGRMDRSGDERGIDDRRHDPARLVWPAYAIAVETLSEQTAGRILRAYGEVEVQVNRLVPREQRRAVARHVTEYHYERCETRTCLAAQRWLRAAHRLRLIEPASA